MRKLIITLFIILTIVTLAVTKEEIKINMDKLTIKDNKQTLEIDPSYTEVYKSKVYDYKNISIVINEDLNIFELFPSQNSDYSIEFKNIDNLLTVSKLFI